MSDWGKLLLWMLKTMPWIVCLISAFLAFFPESLTPDVFLSIRQEWGGWFAVLFLVSLAFSVVWLIHRFRVLCYEMQRFQALAPKAQFLLLDLYFGRLGAAEVPMREPVVADLLANRYLVRGNAGMVLADREHGMVIMVVLSARSRKLFESKEKKLHSLYQGYKTMPADTLRLGN